MFETFLIQPIYNGFVALIGVMPQGDVGLAIIATTLIFRAVFYPAFTSSIRTQMGMQAVQPELDEINKKYKDKPEERTRRTMELFRERKIRPFAVFFTLLIQLPVFFALYLVFFREGLPAINEALLYPFVAVPQLVSVDFFGIMNLLAEHNIPLAILVGATQYAAIRLTILRMGNGAANLSPERAAAQKIQRQIMLYFLPALMTGFSYAFPAGVGLYFMAGNLVSLAQEWWVKHRGV
jgi:YidC/Oxa1 family membrane protein insertase